MSEEEEDEGHAWDQLFGPGGPPLPTMSSESPIRWYAWAARTTAPLTAATQREQAEACERAARMHGQESSVRGLRPAFMVLPPGLVPVVMDQDALESTDVPNHRMACVARWLGLLLRHNLPLEGGARPHSFEDHDRVPMDEAGWVPVEQTQNCLEQCPTSI